MVEANEDTPYPGWDALRDEETEDTAAIILTVQDANGNIVQRIEGPAKAGFHRVAWDLRYPNTSPWKPEPPTDEHMPVSGPLAEPVTNRRKFVKGSKRDIIFETEDGKESSLVSPAKLFHFFSDRFEVEFGSGWEHMADKHMTYRYMEKAA